MMRICRKVMLLVGLAVIVAGIDPADAQRHPPEYYLEYEFFKELTALAPELTNPRPVTLLGGIELWADGELGLPKEGAMIEGDFNLNEIDDAALLIADDSGYALLVVDYSDGQWQRAGLRRFDTQRELELHAKYQMQANAWDGEWAGDVNLLEYAVQDNGPYDLMIRRAAGSPHWTVTAEILKDGEKIYTWDTSPGGAFRIRNNIAYHTEFTGSASGMYVKACDLKNGEELWTTELIGMGPIAHSRYRNWGAHLSFPGDGVIEVTGKEIYGTYIEFVDETTGKTIAHRMIWANP